MELYWFLSLQRSNIHVQIPILIQTPYFPFRRMFLHNA